MRFAGVLLLLMSLAVPLLADSSIKTNLVQKREAARTMSVSVIIPCIPKHFCLLAPLLEAYQKQTVPPHEVIISLSQSNKVSLEACKALENRGWGFGVKILRHVGKKSAGDNRNTASRCASGQILMYQDADDLPHPQRVEIVKHVFENYPIDHLLHFWVKSREELKPYSAEQVSPIHYSAYPAYSVEEGALHNGNVSVSRELFHRIKWGTTYRGNEDVEFNVNAYRFFKTTAVVSLPLIVYRNELSSFAK
jgi:glycosyltransferase involved in cell wall biosynthesis